MKKIVYTFALLLGVNAALLAQPDPMKWGKIDQEDLDMTEYAPDKTASAVVLGDYAQLEFKYSDQNGFQLYMKHHVRIKILTKEGLEWGNAEIPLYQSGSRKEKINSISGVVYNMENGKVVSSKLTKDARSTEQVNANLQKYKFTLPNVKEGSVIEYEYEKISDFIYGLETWYFQTTIPTRWSEYRVRIPEYFTYKHFLGGYHGLNVNEAVRYNDRIHSLDLSFTGTAHRWALGNVPALVKEAYITTLNDYASKIEFELSSTQFPNQKINYYSNSWEKLTKTFLDSERFGGELKKQRQVSDLVKSLIAGKVSPEEKLAAIYGHVQHNVVYNDQERVYASNSFKETLAKRSGNSAEINLLLTAMLREAGLAAHPVILSTRSHGRVNPVIPLEKDFNYVVCQVVLGDKALLLDATEPFLPPGQLPYRCMNDQGRLMQENTSEWVPLLQQEKESYSLSAKLRLTSSGTLQGTLSYIKDGYAAVAARKQLYADGENKFLEKLKEKKTNWTITEHQFANQMTLANKLEEHYTLEILDRATLAGNKLYVSLLPDGVLEANPFKLEERLFPVNFGCPLEQMLMYEIELPEGYSVEQLPEPAIVTLPDRSATFRFNVQQMGNKVNVTSMMQIRKPLYLADEYQQLKEFYSRMLAKQNEQLVLVKK
ncbi:DUF3857 domain-containing transglutaminase family protein [Cesiribacter andamanensis]|uniref:DUF3857 domain-containing protein n=1 Tax=Cesiribacter andamanensis AMV16 TaxID=1279009 RepID=M7NAR4_9BACT|nr:DUF3857 and transglutaminase domain-containing protein [Cesiribacter andamanensis]EMR04352.1 putative protein involved in cytokinesis [Cesiribacter andamanensis AMV16]